ncbi:MAG TPA: PQQ-dependent sugar dehydrogenase [Candidatus Limnocylindrales bacterium]|nr:PQQ-dependent sugar dehydrogenase [Candidatus Limnocylindrales bacterium]
MADRSRALALGAAMTLIATACSSPSSSPVPSTASNAPSSSASASASASPNAAATMTDPSLAVATLAEGLDQPTAIAFVGKDDALVTEKTTGRVMRIQRGQLGEPVIDLAVNGFDERGLLGITLHPDFASNGFVYLYWTQRKVGGTAGASATEDPQQLLGEDSDKATDVPDLGNRVDRFKWDGTALTWDRNIIKLRSNTLDTDTSGRVRGNHDAGPIAFGPDGKLYMTLGDQNQRGQLQNLKDGPAPDDKNLVGVIVRLNDDGSIPADNPFFAQGGRMGGAVGTNVQKIFAYGIRNTFGMTFDRVSGSLWETENGDDASDEVNVFPAGANSGWIQLMGSPDRFDEWKQLETGSPDGFDNPEFGPDKLAADAAEAKSRMFSLDGSAFTPPVLTYKYPPALTAVAIVRDDALGASSKDTAWFGTVLTDALLRYPLAANGSGLALKGGLTDKVDDNAAKGDLGESKDNVAGTGFGVVTDIRQGPDGKLYVVSLSDGTVYRIGPAEGGASASPSVTASASGGASPSTSGSAGGIVQSLTIGTTTNGELKFDPTTASVASGSQVSLTFENRDKVPHNLTFGEPINAKTSTIVQPGASEHLSFTAPAPGSYAFACTLHPGMEGTLQVT